MARFKLVDIIAFLSCLLIISIPFLKPLSVNTFLLISIFGAFGWASTVWVANIYRNISPTVIFMLDNLRRSKHLPGILGKYSGSKDKLPGQAYIPYDGLSGPGVSVGDRSCAIVPNVAIEQLNEDTMLVYAPATPLDEPRLLKGIHSAFADIAEKNPWVTLSLKEKTRSEVRFTFLSSLVVPVDNEMMFKSQRITKRSGSIVADQLNDAIGGERGTYEAMREKMASEVNPTLKDRIKKVFGGEDTATSSEADRPNQGSGGMGV